MTTPAARAREQYATTTENLASRIAIYDYRTNEQDWYSWLGERLPLSGDVIEVGAGTGALWSRVDPAAHPMRLTLTDFSPAMCERLRQVPGVTVLRSDATRLPFPDESADLLIANHMLYHLDDPEAGLREFARVLRPGGRLAMGLNGDDHLAELADIGPAVGRTDLGLRPGHNDISASTAGAYVGTLFDDVTSERYPCALEVPGPEPVLRYLASQGRAPLTAAEEEAARDFIAARIAADGSFRIRQHAVLITARKGARGGAE
ncbi:class I SAM-dependent methyltransferase [Paractinoplanes lichenicola]|uniref:Methyltransferase domain-containing protein n=1 Tax=Paractinoplanes lichenicola TaxID=2802976 RepID=A0ABS1VX04_9ACTN|nr:class I SAM-dependent methyltransferase [Actinoplanes lichenicola]MBL7259002.1 methyltransferase domain-containing protein [Actinoplanes lichenicola]